MNHTPTTDEIQELERAHFRLVGRRGLAKCRAALDLHIDWQSDLTRHWNPWAEMAGSFAIPKMTQR